MKKTIIALSILAISALSVSAAPQQKVREVQCNKVENCAKASHDTECKKHKDLKQRKHEKQDMFAGLNLTDTQKEQIKKLRENQKEVSKDQRKQNRQQFDAQLKQILTPEQYAQFQDKCQQKKCDAPKQCHKDKKDCNKPCTKSCEK